VHTQKILFYGYRKKIPSAYPQGPKILFGEIGVAGIHHLKDDAIAFIKGKDPSLDDYPSVSYNFLLSERFLKILVVQRWVLCLLENLESPPNFYSATQFCVAYNSEARKNPTISVSFIIGAIRHA
jgi:hypothetical protein